MRIMVLHIKLKKSLAFLPSISLPDSSRYLVRFFVLKLTTNFHLVGRASSIMPSCCIAVSSQTQDIVTFVNLQIWGKLAENFGNLVKKDPYLSAGRELAIHPVQAQGSQPLPGRRHEKGQEGNQIIPRPEPGVF